MCPNYTLRATKWLISATSPSLKGPCRQKTSLFYSKNFVFYSAVSTCSAANGAWFTHKLNVFSHNSNSPNRVFSWCRQWRLKSRALKLHIACRPELLTSHRHPFGNLVYRTFHRWHCNTAEVPELTLCFRLDVYTCRIFITVHTNVS